MASGLLGIYYYPPTDVTVHVVGADVTRGLDDRVFDGRLIDENELVYALNYHLYAGDVIEALPPGIINDPEFKDVLLPFTLRQDAVPLCDGTSLLAAGRGDTSPPVDLDVFAFPHTFGDSRAGVLHLAPRLDAGTALLSYLLDSGAPVVVEAELDAADTLDTLITSADGLVVEVQCAFAFGRAQGAVTIQTPDGTGHFEEFDETSLLEEVASVFEGEAF